MLITTILYHTNIGFFPIRIINCITNSLYKFNVIARKKHGNIGGKRQLCPLPFAEVYHGNAEVQRRVLANLMDWWDSCFSARSKLCKTSKEKKTYYKTIMMKLRWENEVSIFQKNVISSTNQVLFWASEQYSQSLPSCPLPGEWGIRGDRRARKHRNRCISDNDTCHEESKTV